MDIANPLKRYHHGAHAVYSCQYHVIWCPKYRRKVLTNGIDERLKELIHEKQEEYGYTIIELEIMPDHVHALLDVDPTRHGINNVVSKIKGYTSRTLRQEYPELCTKLPTLWSRARFISTVGSVSLETIKKYIENQKKMSNTAPNAPNMPLLPDHKAVLANANAQRMRTRAETLARHARMKPNIINLKIDKSHLSKTKKQKLVSMFCQGKWCYNAFLDELNSGKKLEEINKQPASVPVKCGNEWEQRDVSALGSLVKSGIFKRVASQLKGLATKKSRGEKVGALHHKPRMDSLPLRRRGEGYSFKDKADKPYNHVRFTNNPSWYRVRGGEQFLELFARYGESACEFADGKLIDDGYGDFYLQVTVFTPYPEHEPTGRVCALDFGSSDKAHVTTSDGEVLMWKFLESERLKDAQRRNQAFRDWSGAHEGRARSSVACKRVIHDEYARISNAKDDAAAKFVHGLFELYDYVVLQDEQLSAWACDEKYSGSVHHSIMGRVLSRLKNHPRAIVIDRWAPTTRVCSRCGHVLVDGLPVGVREWVCPSCGSVLHRDVNACGVMLLEASGVLGEYYSVCDGVPRSERCAGERGSVRVSRSDALLALADRVGDQSVI